MKSPPTDLADSEVADAVGEGWGLVVDRVAHSPLGGGSYHWIVHAVGSERFFVSVDDLEQKPYLGAGRKEAFEGLRRALGTAVALRGSCGLEFVAAPLPSRDGTVVRSLGERWAIALYPFIAGTPGRFGANRTEGERSELVRLVARLHLATAMVRDQARTPSLDLPGRQKLIDSLEGLQRSRAGGPLSEAARQVLAPRVGYLTAQLAEFDRMLPEVERRAVRDAVITHGEMHGGNQIAVGTQCYLIDWDTSGLAVPERDLWMLDPSPKDVELYERLTGHSVNRSSLDFYRLRWMLDDVSSFAEQLLGQHRDTADTRHWLRALKAYLD